MVAVPGKLKGGRSPRRKGNRIERELVQLLQQAGFAAERIPLSGSAGGRFAGDLTVPLLGRDHVGEVKSRASGFRRLYSWLRERDFLVLRDDRREPLVVLPLKLAIEIAIKAEQPRGPRGFDQAIGIANPLAAQIVEIVAPHLRLPAFEHERLVEQVHELVQCKLIDVLN